MVSRELNFGQNQITDSFLQTVLEQNNPSYSEARQLYNQLIKNTINPLADFGLSENKSSFIILLLEKVLRNTELLLQNNFDLETKLHLISTRVFELSEKGLEPIVLAGNQITSELNKLNQITSELNKFDIGFRDWNKKFENFITIFHNWDTGFQNFEEQILKLETKIFEHSNYWTNNINTLAQNIAKTEASCTQWSNELNCINNNLSNLKQTITNIDFKPALVKTPNKPFTSLPTHSHTFTF